MPDLSDPISNSCYLFLLVLVAMQLLAKTKLPVVERREEVLIENLPPLLCLEPAREERERILKATSGQEPPPTSFFTRRRLQHGDFWYIEVFKATVPGSSRDSVFMALNVVIRTGRRDIYVVDKVVALYLYCVRCMCCCQCSDIISSSFYGNMLPSSYTSFSSFCVPQVEKLVVLDEVFYQFSSKAPEDINKAIVTVSHRNLR